jgi:LemA protein
MTKNRFRRLIVKIGEGESGIDVALTKRYDTLNKMLEVCRQYAAHEVETFTKMIELRRGMSMTERQMASVQMDDMTARLNVVAEQYPELRSAEVFRDLQAGIRDTEEHLQAARRLYNANVSAFNQYLAAWPYSVIGKEYKPYAFFEAEQAKRADVSMKL